MAELSSNWKKLQAKLKADSSSTQPKKRKAEVQLQPLTSKTKVTKTVTKQTASEARHTKPSHRKMGGVQSSVSADKAKNSVSPSLAIWAGKKDVSAEDLAEAYELGIKGKSMMLEAGRDKVNQGIAGGIKIGKYIAMDCEMVGVGPGGHESALARVSLVDFHGQQIYDSYVKPKERVTDWRTFVSGISQKEMRFARDFEEVQREVHSILASKILVGHDIKHDLEALKLSHPPRDIRDTAKYPSFKQYGNGRKPALKTLAREILGMEIQHGAHSSTEDARATMLLFRKHKSGFDVDNANRYNPKPPVGAGPRKGKKSTKKR
ncbi:RNA exonuclease 4 [Cladobotryum mycophilum]|uniref:RNA exonuclease 4 n=1 Tax=Cladobotryum mycophilum TaxID=491253 RepID=A0ABR0T278_9HYPO